MRNLSGWRIFLLAAPVVLLLAPVSVLVVILERISKNILYQHTYRDFRSGEFMITLNGRNSTTSTTNSDINVAMQIDNAPMLAILGVLSGCVYRLCARCVWDLGVEEGGGDERASEDVDVVGGRGECVARCA